MAVLIAIVFILLNAGAAIAAPAQALLIDRSGSMKPYYDNHLIQDVSGAIIKTLQVHGDVALFAFGTTVTSLQNLPSIESLPYGESTYLDRAIDRVTNGQIPIAWMITDNIQDQPGTPEAGNTEVFYSKLRGDLVKRVTIFPLKQAPGHPGIVIYALLFDEVFHDQYQSEIDGFKNLAGNTVKTDALRMKPLDRDTIEVRFQHSNADSKADALVYQTGTPVKEKIQIRFKSRFEHLEISDAQIRVVESEPRFDSDSLILPERRKVSITPQKVAQLGPGNETEQIYDVDVDLGTLRLRKDLRSLWRAAWGKPEEQAQLKLTFSIEVPQQNFRLRPQFLQNFNAATLAQAKATGKVYAVDQLPRLMGESVTAVRVEAPLVFRIAYPWWPSVLFVLVILIGTTSVVFLAVRIRSLSFSGAKSWVVTAETEKGIALDCRVDKGQIEVQRDVIGSIEKNTFIPAKGVALENNVTSTLVRLGLRLKIQTPRRPVVLVFQEDKGKAESADAYVPNRR